MSSESTDSLEYLRAEIYRNLDPPYDGSYRGGDIADDALCSRIRQWIPDGQARVDSHYRVVVRSLEEQLRVANMKLQLAEVLIAHNRSVIGALWKLPPDILLIIFRDVAVDHAESLGWQPANTVPGFLTQVCRYWRAVLRDTFLVSVLSTVSLRAPHGKRNDGRVGMLRIPDAVRVRFDFIETAGSIAVVADFDDGLYVASWEAALDFANSWTHLSLTAVYGVIRITHTLAQLLHTTPHFDNLSSLFLNGGLPDSRRDASELPRWANLDQLLDVMPPMRSDWDYSSLRHVVLHNIVTPESTLDFPWASLTSYEEDSSIRPHRMMPSNVMLPGVTDLGGSRILLPSLRYFSYTVLPFPQSIDLFAAVDFPNVEHLCLCGGPLGRRHCDAVGGMVCLHCCLKGFLQRCDNIVDLELYWNMDILCETTTDLLDLTPFLRRFSVRTQSEGLFGGDLLRYLSIPNSVRLLESLSIPDPIVTDAMSVTAWKKAFEEMGNERFRSLKVFSLRCRRPAYVVEMGPIYRMGPDPDIEPKVQGLEFNGWNGCWGRWGDFPYTVWLELDRMARDCEWPFLTDMQVPDSWSQTSP
ncbi:hypothetical protein C8J57DRAFT_1527950 [Mycena rebaudengoi]|nr:hypothetical protein C8J57DRAFT_1527950 [Mycena rebaudengoi]